MKKTYHILATLSAIFLMACPPANADWINLSGAQNAPNIAEININDDNIKIDLEIFVNNLVTFDRLIPDEFFWDLWSDHIQKVPTNATDPFIK